MDCSCCLLRRMPPTDWMPLDNILPLVVQDMPRLNAIATQQTSPLHDCTVSLDNLAYGKSGTARAGMHGVTQLW
jgi:hypothetical protein